MHHQVYDAETDSQARLSLIHALTIPILPELFLNDHRQTLRLILATAVVLFWIAAAVSLESTLPLSLQVA